MTVVQQRLVMPVETCSRLCHQQNLQHVARLRSQVHQVQLYNGILN
jgi:hypothetical protein